MTTASTRQAASRSGGSHKVPGDKRERILDAALSLFAARGFHGTAVPLVAERAQVGAGTIYRYFDTKEALVNALYRKWKLTLLDFVLHDFPVTVGMRDQFHHFFVRIVAFSREHADAFQFLELHHHAPYLDAESHAVEERSLLFVRSFVHQMQTQRAVKAGDADVLSCIVWGGLVRLLKGACDGQLALTPAVLEQAENVCWEAIRS